VASVGIEIGEVTGIGGMTGDVTKLDGMERGSLVGDGRIGGEVTAWPKEANPLCSSVGVAGIGATFGSKVECPFACE